MKRIVLLAFLLSIVYNAPCQQCKFVNKEIVEETTGLPIKNQTYILIDGSSNKALYFSTNGCWIHLNLLILKSSMSRKMDFHSRTPLILNFNDSSNIMLFPVNDNRSTLLYSENVLGGAWISKSYYLVQYSISLKELETLNSKALSNIIYHFSHQNMGFPITDSSKIEVYNTSISINKRRDKNIKELVSCILQEKKLSPEYCSQTYKFLQAVKSATSDDEALLNKVQSGIPLQEISVSSSEDLSIGDIVKYSTPYGDTVYGIVVKKQGKSKVRIRSYSSPGSPFESDEKVLTLVKIKKLF